MMGILNYLMSLLQIILKIKATFKVIKKKKKEEEERKEKPK